MELLEQARQEHLADAKSLDKRSLLSVMSSLMAAHVHLGDLHAAEDVVNAMHRDAAHEMKISHYYPLLE